MFRKRKMMKKISIGLNIVLIVVLTLFYQYHKEKMILNIAISNSKSSVYLYALDENKTNMLKTLLVSDLILLIDNYEYKLYQSSRNIKKVLCDDIPKYHDTKIKEYLTGMFYESEEGKQFKIHTLRNLDLIKNEFCLDFKNKD